MPETEAKQAESRTKPATGSVRETRIDPPHEYARAPEEKPLPSGVAADERPVAERLASDNVIPLGHDFVAEETAEQGGAAELSFALGEIGEEITPELIQQFQAQARQLAAHLETRQRDLDRREGELNAALAQHDAASRSSRLWFQERHHDLLDRQKELERRDQHVTERLLELDRRMEMGDTADGSTSDQQREVILIARENDLAVRDLELVRRLAEVDELAAQTTLNQQAILAREQKLQAREEKLVTAEAVLARDRIELNDARKIFAAERAEAQSRLDREQRQFHDQRRQAEAEHARQARTVAARWTHLQRRGAALDQSRAEALRLQREALEMRLVTEELWAQMSGMAPTESLTQSLAGLRAKLAEQYRMQLSDIATQRRQVEELAGTISSQHEKLAINRRSFDVWSADQKREISAQSAALSAREEELRLERQRMQDERRNWDSERSEIERELRRLQAERQSAREFLATS